MSGVRREHGLCCGKLLIEQRANLSRDHHVLAGGYGLDREVTEESQPVRDGFANVAPVLAHAARERERVDAPERGRHRRDGLCHAVGVDGEPERVVEPAECLEARLLVE